MKHKRAIALDERDEKVVELFTELGMPKNLAKTLMYLSQVEECKSSDIEQGTNLRQPEVSVAIQEMRRKGWVKKKDLKKEGKGRPIHIYKLTKPLSSILKTFQEEKMKELETIKNDLTDLQNLIQQYSSK